jgi:hypothetical protein
MTDNPCNTCREDCLGGIIYGNCVRYRNWYKGHMQGHSFGLGSQSEWMSVIFSKSSRIRENYCKNKL